jgi:hypothetical protein
MARATTEAPSLADGPTLTSSRGHPIRDRTILKVPVLGEKVPMPASR